MNTSEPVQRFYRFHPITGQDANDIPTERMSDEDKAELANTVRAGALFYWDKVAGTEPRPYDVQGYCRIEKANVTFVLKMTGMQYEFIDTPPERI